MLAEVLYRVKKLFTAAAAAVFALTSAGCEWDDAEIPDADSVADKVTTEDETLTEEETIEPETEDEVKLAKAVFEKWLGLIAEGESETANEMLTDDLKAVAPRARLFNEDFPGKSAEYFAPAVVTISYGKTTVTLKATVSSEVLPECSVRAEISVVITDDGSVKIDQIRELGDASDERKLFRRAYIAYKAAEEVFDEIDPVPFNGMHHMGSGSKLAEAVRKETCPVGDESFSIAVRDKRIMYVCWSNGSNSQIYPKRQ